MLATMNMWSRVSTALVGAALIASAPPALADHHREFSFSIGYAQLSVDDEALQDLDHKGGVRFEPRLTWTPSADDAQRFRLGVGIGFAFFYDEEDTGETVGGFADVEDFEQISLIVPELQATWRQPVHENWFVEGGVGVGAVIGNFRAGQVIFDDLFDEDVSDWDLGFGVRPLVRVGYTKPGWVAGLEGSYLFTDLDFGNDLGGSIEELYIGLFFSHMF